VRMASLVVNWRVADCLVDEDAGGWTAEQWALDRWWWHAVPRWPASRQTPRRTGTVSDSAVIRQRPAAARRLGWDLGGGATL
jgi:hypothetical protein